MTLSVSIPGLAELELENLLLDVNGTLSNRGALISDLAARIRRLSDELDVRLVSADTFGTLDSIARAAGGSRRASGDRRAETASARRPRPRALRKL